MYLQDEGRRLPDSDLYRVVGLKADNSRCIVADNLPRERAIHVRDLLIGAGAFHSVNVEPERQSQPA